MFTLKESRTENWKSPAEHRNHFVVTFLINLIPFPIPTCTGLCTVALIVSDSSQPMGCITSQVLCQWDFLGKHTGMGCHFLLQGIFPTQGSNLCLLLLNGRRTLLLAPPGKPTKPCVSALFVLLRLQVTLCEEKGTTEDEMVGWHHRLNGHEFE